jgi:nucleotide-binding universal stress UspA family protein
MKLLVGYDGSRCAELTLGDIERGGFPREAEVMVVSVAEAWMTVPLTSVQRATTSAYIVTGSAGRDGTAVAARLAEPKAVAARTPLEEAKALADHASERLQVHFSDWRLEAEAMSGSPAREILKKADEWYPDLIVLGCQGRAGLGRFLLGSVTQKVVSEAPCSVRVSRGTAWKRGSPVRLMVGLDHSAGSRAVVSAVIKRAWPQGSEVRLVAIADSTDGIGSDSIGADRLVELATAELKPAGLRVTSRIEIGDPKNLLVAAANEWGADCIFVGSTGSDTEAGTLGSVATAVVNRAHCSVEVIRPS